MKIFYNPENEGFYHEGVQKNVPKSALEITPIQYSEFRTVQTQGKKVVLKGDVLVFEDRTPSPEDLVHLEMTWVASELVAANEELDKVQDSDPSATGTVTEWRSYRRQLRAWSEDINFPDRAFRPKSPKI